MTLQSLTQKMLNVFDRQGLTKRRLIDYSALLSGQVGRLFFSMLYFITLTRALSLGEFGLFATASAIGIVLSRLTGFGFLSPLFRVATVKPALIGIYTAGFLLAALLSLPILAALGAIVYALLYSGTVNFLTFALILAAEIIFWRGLEAVIIVNNGLNRYLTGSLLAIGGVAVKSVTALLFLLYGSGKLDQWAMLYCASLAASTVLAIAFFYPRQRLRWKPKAWFGRARDAVGVSAAEALFYVQAELDKVLVLALGGEVLAGLYAIIMRLIDLTAIPLRAFATMLTQWIMRERKAGASARTGMKLDLIIGATSVLALVVLAVLLSFFPTILGDSIAQASNLLWLVLLVPAFRNIIELHTELLYGHQRMAARVWLLLLLTTLKACLLALLLVQFTEFKDMALWLNGVFAVLYATSAATVYRKVLRPSR